MIELFDSNILKIMTIFSTSPGSRLNRKLIKEKTRIANIILDKTLAKLINFKVLIKEKGFFALNFKNTEVKEITNLAAENYLKFKQIPLKEYFILFNITEEFSKIKDIGDVYLFGSYAKLIFRENSDIDIAVISEIDKKEMNKITSKLEKKHNKKIEIHFFTKKFYNNKRDPLVKEILQHGIKMI